MFNNQQYTGKYGFHCYMRLYGNDLHTYTDIIQTYGLPCGTSREDQKKVEVSIMYSPEHVPSMDGLCIGPLAARVTRFQVKNGNLVLRLNSPEMNARHLLWRHRGAVPELEHYEPHIVLIPDVAADFKSDNGYTLDELCKIQQHDVLYFGMEEVRDCGIEELPGDRNE